MKKFKNNKETADVWCGIEIQPGAYHEIDSIELKCWQNDSKALTSIATGEGIVNNGSIDIVDVASAINFLRDEGPKDVNVIDSIALNSTPPFAAKQIGNYKLFRRVHGSEITLAANGDTTVSFTVPYNKVKITGMQICWAPEGINCDMEVLDTPQGAVQISMGVPPQSAVPSAKLNQFGFGAGIRKDWHEDVSDYDADLIKDMVLKITLHNPTSVEKSIRVNFILHELK